LSSAETKLKLKEIACKYFATGCTDEDIDVPLRILDPYDPRDAKCVVLAFAYYKEYEEILKSTHTPVY